MVSVVSLLSFRCFGGFVSVFRWFRSIRAPGDGKESTLGFSTCRISIKHLKIVRVSPSSRTILR